MAYKLVPEFDVADLDASLRFYTSIFGFRVLYDRPEERFVFLDLDGVQLMLEEAAGPGRRFRTAPLEHPYGRGVNFQIQVADVSRLYNTACTNECVIVIPLENRWYRVDEHVETGNQQFVVADPDGYLLRFFSDLGRRNVNTQQ